MLDASRRRLFAVLGLAIGAVGVACSSFSSSNGDGPGAPDGAVDGDAAAEAHATSRCAEGRRTTLLASGVARVIASDDRGAYWTDAADSGAFLNVATPDGGSRFPADAPEISFIAPHAPTVAYVQHNPDDFCWLREYARGSGGISPLKVGTGCVAAFYAGDITGIVLAHLDPYAPSYTLQRLQPTADKLTLDQPGKPVSMAYDGVWVYVLFTDGSGYSAIWRYSFAGMPENLTQDAGALGPIALWNDKLVWLTSAGGLRSMATTGGVIEDHGTVAGAKRLAVGGDCVFVATGDAVVSVDPADGWAPHEIDRAIAVELSASRSGVFWTTPLGGVEALWR